jgi:hypothetical protein
MLVVEARTSQHQAVDGHDATQRTARNETYRSFKNTVPFMELGFILRSLLDDKA